MQVASPSAGSSSTTTPGSVNPRSSLSLESSPRAQHCRVSWAPPGALLRGYESRLSAGYVRSARKRGISFRLARFEEFDTPLIGANAGVLFGGILRTRRCPGDLRNHTLHHPSPSARVSQVSVRIMCRFFIPSPTIEESCPPLHINSIPPEPPIEQRAKPSQERATKRPNIYLPQNLHRPRRPPSRLEPPHLHRLHVRRAPGRELPVGSRASHPAKARSRHGTQPCLRFLRRVGLLPRHASRHLDYVPYRKAPQLRLRPRHPTHASQLSRRTLLRSHLSVATRLHSLEGRPARHRRPPPVRSRGFPLRRNLALVFSPRRSSGGVPHPWVPAFHSHAGPRRHLQLAIQNTPQQSTRLLDRRAGPFDPL